MVLYRNTKVFRSQTKHVGTANSLQTVKIKTNYFAKFAKIATNPPLAKTAFAPMMTLLT